MEYAEHRMVIPRLIGYDDFSNAIEEIDFLMTRKEAAAFIGKSLRQFDRLRDKGRIATEVVDGELRFWRSHLLKFKGYSQVGPDPNKYRWYND